jgi:TPR repeat protein
MLGDAIAQNNLGVCYEYGKGVRQDYNEAVSWYMRSAHQGCALAQYNLGVCYQYGRGVMPNAAEAMRWFHLANEQGNIHKQHKAYNNSNCGNLAQKIGNATSQGSSNYRSEEPADTSHTTLRGLSKFLGRK